MPVRMEPHYFPLILGSHPCQSLLVVCPNSSPFISWHDTQSTTGSPQLKQELLSKGGADLVGGLSGSEPQGLVSTPQPSSMQVTSDSGSLKQNSPLPKEKWKIDVETGSVLKPEDLQHTYHRRTHMEKAGCV